MNEPNEAEVPEGAAVFPEIPAELGVNPLLLGVLHATVFLAGSDEEVIAPAAADEAIQYLQRYLQRLQGEALKRVQEDLEVLIAHGREEKWPKQLVRFLREFLETYEVGSEESEEEA